MLPRWRLWPETKLCLGMGLPTAELPNYRTKNKLPLLNLLLNLIALQKLKLTYILMHHLLTYILTHRLLCTLQYSS